MAPQIENATNSIEQKLISSVTIIEKKQELVPNTPQLKSEEEDEQAILLKIMTAHQMPMIITPKPVKKLPFVNNTAEADERSVYVGNVDYGVSIKELEDHFQSCGPINRVTIPTNYAKQPKGFGYVEFTDIEGAKKALSMNGTQLKGREIKVNPKRTNQPGFSGGKGGHRCRTTIVQYVYCAPTVDRKKYSKRYAPYSR